MKKPLDFITASDPRDVHFSLGCEDCLVDSQTHHLPYVANDRCGKGGSYIVQWSVIPVLGVEISCATFCKVSAFQYSFFETLADGLAVMLIESEVETTFRAPHMNHCFLIFLCGPEK